MSVDNEERKKTKKKLLLTCPSERVMKIKEGRKEGRKEERNK